jgi:[ribosomal protein S5]-alanine N-acetyltransferase
MGVPKNFGEKEFTAMLARHGSALRNGAGINWVVEKDGAPVALAACHSTNWKLQATEIGFATIPAFRGQGIMSSVLAELAKFLVSEYGFERVEVQADVANVGSRRVAEKVGFTFEGHLRRRYLNGDELTDDAVYSIIKEDLAR